MRNRGNTGDDTTEKKKLRFTKRKHTQLETKDCEVLKQIWKKRYNFSEILQKNFFEGGGYFAGHDICFVQRMWFFWLHPQIGAASIVQHQSALVCCGKDGVNQEGIYIPTLAYSQEFGYKPEESQTQVQI